MTANLIDLDAARERRVLTEAVPSGRQWQDRGACGSPRPDVEKMRVMSPMFDVRTLGAARSALEVCGACPVVGECFAFGLVDDDFEGVAGGVVFVEKKIDGKMQRLVLRPGAPAVPAAAVAEGVAA